MNSAPASIDRRLIEDGRVAQGRTTCACGLVGVGARRPQLSTRDWPARKGIPSSSPVPVVYRGGQEPLNGAIESAVVETQWMKPDERCLPLSPRTHDGLLREVIRQRCRSNSLGDISTSIVTLDEHPSGIPGSRWQPFVPYVRYEEGNVTCLGHDRNDAAAIPGEIVVGQPLPRRWLSRHVAFRNQPSRA